MTQALDEEIFRLQQVKQLLQGNRHLSPALAKMVKQGPAKRVRQMTDEGRRRIAEAQKRRWGEGEGRLAITCKL